MYRAIYRCHFFHACYSLPFGLNAQPCAPGCPCFGQSVITRFWKVLKAFLLLDNKHFHKNASQGWNGRKEENNFLAQGNWYTEIVERSIRGSSDCLYWNKMGNWVSDTRWAPVCVCLSGKDPFIWGYLRFFGIKQPFFKDFMRSELTLWRTKGSAGFQNLKIRTLSDHFLLSCLYCWLR